MKISWIDRLLYLVFQKEPLDLSKSFVKRKLFIFRTILLYTELWDLKKVFCPSFYVKVLISHDYRRENKLCLEPHTNRKLTMLERADRLGQSCPGPVRSKSDLPEVVEEAGEKVRVFQLIIQKLFNEINRFFFWVYIVCDSLFSVLQTFVSGKKNRRRLLLY